MIFFYLLWAKKTLVFFVCFFVLVIVVYVYEAMNGVYIGNNT